LVSIHLAAHDIFPLNKSNLLGYSLDPDLHWENGVLINDEPLLVNTINSYQYRPDSNTSIPNFFLASDFIRTVTDIASMEAADDSGRLAVNSILKSDGRSDFVKLFEEDWPHNLVLDELRSIDLERWKKGEEPIEWNLQP